MTKLMICSNNMKTMIKYRYLNNILPLFKNSWYILIKSIFKEYAFTLVSDGE